MIERLARELFRSRRTTSSDAADADVQPASAKDVRAVDFSTADSELPDFWLRERSALQDLTIILPILPGRGNFLSTLLSHLSVSELKCPILMTVNSDAVRETALEEAVAAHPGLDVRVLYHPMGVYYLDRLNDCARQARTKYVFVHADDDFVVAGALADCVEFLDGHLDFVACQGRSVFFGIKDDRYLIAHPQRFLTRAEDSAVARVLEHCRNYTSTFHAVVRREAFIECYEHTMKHTDQLIFWQYLASCSLLSLGRMKVLDKLFYLRLNNPNGGRATLMRTADRRHWPYFIVAPDFSLEQEKFKRGLVAAMAGGAPEERLMEVADECCLGLISRAFGAPLRYDEAELRMHSRFYDPTTYEASVARYCGPRALTCLRSMNPSTGTGQPVE
jgi:glycosyltransferase domain-containing protein